MKKTLYSIVAALALFALAPAQAEESFETRLGKLAATMDALQTLSGYCVVEVKVYGALDGEDCSRFRRSLNAQEAYVDPEWEALRKIGQGMEVEEMSGSVRRDAATIQAGFEEISRNMTKIGVLLGAE
jgi:hypothetical protein